MEDEIGSRIVVEDGQYPLLVIHGPFGHAGYWIDKATGDLRRVCICAAHCPSDCICGGWSEERPEGV